MDRLALTDAINGLQLNAFSLSQTYASELAVRQFNALLTEAKIHFPERADVQSLLTFTETENGWSTAHINLYNDAVLRLIKAINLQPKGAVSELASQIEFPSDASDEVKRDFQELSQAFTSNLHKSVLLLAGSITESLLLSRHPDKSPKGPGLKNLVDVARKERLLGRDTLRQLDTLIDYRDSIHPRAESRNGTAPNTVRSETAINALKLLCTELEDTEVRYGE